MRELFIYYRMSAEHAAAARAQVRRFQAALSERYAGLEARLMGRLQGADGTQTWMETYARRQHPDGVSEVLQAEIESAAQPIAPLIDGVRHCEAFRPL